MLNATVGTDKFIFLRMRTENLAGWPGTGQASDARYKWFFDTNGGGDVAGGNIVGWDRGLGALHVHQYTGGNWPTLLPVTAHGEGISMTHVQVFALSGRLYYLLFRQALVN